MWIEAIITEEDLRQVLATLLPVKIHLDTDPGTDRWIELGKPETVELVESRGMRMSCPAELRWSIVGIDVPVKINQLIVYLTPKVVEKNRGEVLTFGIQLEEADVAGLPGLVDGAIVKAVNAALDEKSLEWDFRETLLRKFEMPGMLEPIATLDLESKWGKVRLSGEAIVLALSLHIAFTRTD
jgi:hypothetical protein